MLQRARRQTRRNTFSASLAQQFSVRGSSLSLSVLSLPAGLASLTSPLAAALSLTQSAQRELGPMRAGLTGLVEGRLAITVDAMDESSAAGDLPGAAVI